MEDIRMGKIHHSSRKQRPWSKLQRRIYQLICPKLDLQIQCVAYPISPRSSTNLPRHWITLGKEIIWDYPKNFISKRQFYSEGREITKKVVYDEWSIPDISALIRDYIDTPKDVLLDKVFSNDRWGLTEILKAADRRIGKERLKELGDKSGNAAVRKIIAMRLDAKNYPSTSGVGLPCILSQQMETKKAKGSICEATKNLPLCLATNPQCETFEGCIDQTFAVYKNDIYLGGVE